MEKHGVIEFRGYSLAVEYDYFAPSKGKREKGSGVQLEPDEDATIELTQVEHNGMEIMGLVEEYTADIEIAIGEQLETGEEPHGDY